MSVRELERFARDLHRDPALYDAALAAGDACQSVAALADFLRRQGYDIGACDLAAAPALPDTGADGGGER
ncbi:Nif11 family protein [Caenispirillum bisanense]|uniref:Nif11 family protein n=1 Tax=Caenispirillum bisanense TaxID=414052 RepID=UPI0031D5E194